MAWVSIAMGEVGQAWSLTHRGRLIKVKGDGEGTAVKKEENEEKVIREVKRAVFGQRSIDERHPKVMRGHVKQGQKGDHYRVNL